MEIFNVKNFKILYNILVSSDSILMFLYQQVCLNETNLMVVRVSFYEQY